MIKIFAANWNQIKNRMIEIDTKMQSKVRQLDWSINAFSPYWKNERKFCLNPPASMKSCPMAIRGVRCSFTTRRVWKRNILNIQFYSLNISSTTIHICAVCTALLYMVFNCCYSRSPWNKTKRMYTYVYGSFTHKIPLPSNVHFFLRFSVLMLHFYRLSIDTLMCSK